MGLILNRRREMRALPYDAEVEYLEFSGTQYIDTGIYANGYTSVNVRFKYNNTTIQTRIFQDVYSGDGCIMTMQSYINGRGCFATAFSDNNGDWVSSDISVDTDIHTLKMDASDLTVYLDGTAVTTRTTRPSNTSDATLKIGYGGVSVMLNGRIYAFQIWSGSGQTLIRDFIPVRVGQVGYLYDKVSGELFGNSGTGDFVLGSDI